nr:VWA domain-containing protein [Blastocatellia bacterium]
DLNLTTDRGIILLNVPPNEVAGDLRERPLTEAAKAIVRSGDSILMEAIRRASPKYFGDYAQTLPPLRRTPTLTERDRSEMNARSSTKVATVQVTDADNRSVSELTNGDFEISEDNEARDIISVRPVSAPVNLVLLLDVSGSVENYVNFIRKAARSFVDTVDRNDRISIVIFSEDVKVLSGFTTDRQRLSESLDTFDAGGPTAYYDAIAYTLADTLRPLGGERTAIVILTDGDDNRSFLAFDSLAGTIQESGAMIYPLYVPSSLIAASASAAPVPAVDPLRARYLGLSTRAEGEGEQLAKLSGGVYYPISQLSQIQTAYEDIARQLRSAYEVTYRSQIDGAAGGRISPRLRVRVKRPDLFANITRVSPVQ